MGAFLIAVLALWLALCDTAKAKINDYLKSRFYYVLLIIYYFNIPYIYPFIAVLRHNIIVWYFLYYFVIYKVNRYIKQRLFYYYFIIKSIHKNAYLNTHGQGQKTFSRIKLFPSNLFLIFHFI